MGIVADTVTWDDYEDQLKAYCHISADSHDSALQILIAAAAARADAWLGAGFTVLNGRITFAGVEVGDTATIDGATFTAAAETDETEREFKVGVDDATDAQALVSLINSDILGGSHGAVGVAGVIASRENAVITLARRYPNRSDITLDTSNSTRLRYDFIRTSEDLPDDVILWVFQFVAWKFGNRDGRKSERSEMGIESVDWGDKPDMSLLDLHVENVFEVV